MSDMVLFRIAYGTVATVTCIVLMVTMKARWMREPDWKVGGVAVDHMNLLTASWGLALIWPVSAVVWLCFKLGSRIGTRQKKRLLEREAEEREVQEALEEMDNEDV